MKIYITHCSAKKDSSLKNTDIKVSPDKLYTATPTQRFMKTCKNKNVNWAILSDEYGIWFPYEKHKWYEKDPNTVSENEFDELVKNFENKLDNYCEIFFYHNPGRFHHLYKRLLEKVKIKDKIRLISHLNDIK
jgi:hypothetical protein